MEKRLDAWRQRFEARRSDAANGDVEVSRDMRERLEAAKVAGDAAFAKLHEMKAIADRYHALRGEMDELWKAIDDNPPAAPRRRAASGM